jgi:hypothetical protein
MLFLDSEQDPPNCLLYQMLEYFNSEPNYVLSSYIIKILTVLFLHHPVRTQ